MTTAAVVAFLAGISLGVGVGWGYIQLLKGKIKLYETYIHERLEKEFAPVGEDPHEPADAGEPVARAARPGPGSHDKPDLQ